jgi:hypothetical protein
MERNTFSGRLSWRGIDLNQNFNQRGAPQSDLAVSPSCWIMRDACLA